MAAITLDELCKEFAETVAVNGVTLSVAVGGVTLSVADGEFLVLVWPSGCGKSTLLRTVAGLETQTDGDLHIGDRLVNDVEPKNRGVAMVFQNYAVYPHMSARRNMTLQFMTNSLVMTTAVIVERANQVGQVGLRYIQGVGSEGLIEWNLVMAAGILVLIPPLLVLLVARRYLLSTLASS